MGMKLPPDVEQKVLAAADAKPSRVVRVVLPWPPTVNTYWRSIVINGQVRVLMSKAGRVYQEQAQADVLAQGVGKVYGRLSVAIDAYPPDRRVRDLDNLLKPILDGLAHAGVYANDGQIDELTICRRPVRPNGEIVVEIEEVSTPGLFPQE